MAGTQEKLIITIDGTSGAGKSVLGAAVAKALGYLYFDTGVLYRALTWLALQEGINLQDRKSLVDLAKNVPIVVRPPTEDDERQYDVIAGAKDVTWLIRSPEVDRSVSIVSAHEDVRAAVLERQREVARPGGVVLVGRDTGTVVCPDAHIKIFLNASVEVRAYRRYLERINRGEPADYESILADLRHRDLLDTSRTVAPLRPAPDAHHINSGELTLEEEIEAILHLVEQYRTRHAQTC